MKYTVVLSLLFFSLNCFSQTRTTEEVYDHHEESFLNQDINALMEDYNDNSILVTPDGNVHKGKQAIRKTFEYAFKEMIPPNSEINVIHKVIEKDLAYLVYSTKDSQTGTEFWSFAVDTFIITDGKIRYQTVAAKIPDDMAETVNKKMLRDYFEKAWNGKNLDFISEVTPEVFTLHFGGKTIEASKEQHKKVVDYWTTVFPDYNISIHDMVAEGDKVAVNYTFTGTQKEKIENIEPTNKKVQVSGIWICRFENGLITECWEEYDVKGMLDQLKGQ